MIGVWVGGWSGWGYACFVVMSGAVRVVLMD